MTANLGRFIPLYSHYRYVAPESAYWGLYGRGLLIIASDEAGTFMDVIGTPRNWQGLGLNSSELSEKRLSQDWGL